MDKCCITVVFSVSSTWTQPETQGPQPPVRHGHVIVAAGSKIYIHGGMANDDFLDDMYSLDPSKDVKWDLSWSHVFISGKKIYT